MTICTASIRSSRPATPDIEFNLLTGVSRFTKVSIFSALNNLTDITLDPDFGTICGYTESDLGTTFAPELSGLDRHTVRDWYNGYSWLGNESVYNPYDVLLLFRQRRFGAHWFETGTPTFLVNVLIERGISGLHLDGMRSTDDLLAAFDIDDISTEALLFQGGYLTIAHAHEEHDELVYQLSYPNREVRQSLNRSLLRALVPERTRRSALAGGVRELLATNDFNGLEASLRAFFSSIPFEWHTRNEIANYEGYYASVCYSHFAGAGLNVAVEESSSAAAWTWRWSWGAMRTCSSSRRWKTPPTVRPGAIARARLCGEVPCIERVDPPDRRGVQPQDAQRGHIRRSERVGLAKALARIRVGNPPKRGVLTRGGPTMSELAAPLPRDVG